MTLRPGASEPLGALTVIANPTAGSTTPELVSAIEAQCAALGVKPTVLWTLERGHATELAAEASSRAGSPSNGLRSAIVSVGGDGTLREVAAGIVAAENPDGPPLIVLPGGTGNSNYRSLWDDRPWQEALAAAVTGVGSQRRLLDLALIDSGTRLVMLGTSTGVFAEATAAAKSLSLTGRGRYQQAIDDVLTTYVPYPGRVTVDGVVLQEGPTTLVNVGGGRHRAGVFEVLPLSVRDDGLLDVCVLGAVLPPAEVLELTRTGAHLGKPGVAYGTGRHIVVERTDGAPLPFEHDGEVADDPAPSLSVRVLERALPVLASSTRSGG